jgi:hypothetical protein
MLAAALAATGAAWAWEPGDRVLARWPGDAMLYPARVQWVDGTRVNVAFDDGDVETVAEGDVRMLTWTVGTRLQCNWKNQGAYYDGVVDTMHDETIAFLYDDGDRETMTISRCRERD